MSKLLTILSKSSVLPTILEIEEQLAACENSTSHFALEQLNEARKQGEKLIEKSARELPGLEEENRRKLLEEVDARVEELKREEERILRELEKRIDRNRQKALDFVIEKVLAE